MTAASDRLSALEEGEIIEGDKLFGGLIDHPVEVLCTKKSDKGVATLELQFMGIKLAAVGGKVTDGKIVWVEVK